MDRAVIATAAELFEARHYPGVVAMCTDALEDEPDCVPLLMIRARARIALRQDLEAQADLRDVIRLDPRSGLAYRLLGELAARRSDNAFAAALFRQALRLQPDDGEAQDWLSIVEAVLPPAPASRPAPALRASRHDEPGPSTRFARGTQPPVEPDTNERPTRPFASAGRSDIRREYASRATPPSAQPVIERATVTGRPPLQPPAKQAPRLFARTGRDPRGSIVELPGFGEYLVANGVLTRERLRAAEAYQRSMKVQLSTAIVTLGLATPQRIAWAAVAHHAEHAERSPRP